MKFEMEPSDHMLLGILTKAIIRWTHLHPVDEASNLLAHHLGVLGGHHIVVLGSGEPVHHNDVSISFPLVQGRHQLGHPTLKHATHLTRGREGRRKREKDVGCHQQRYPNTNIKLHLYLSKPIQACLGAYF